MRKPNVLLASLPWTSLVEPSLGLGILKSELDKHNIDSKICHLNLFLLRYMRSSTYVSIANMFALNEFMFTYVFEQDLSQEQLSELSLKIDEAISNNTFGSDERYSTREAIAELFLVIRNRIIPRYILDCVEQIEAHKPTMVGFTCMFDQTIPSLAIAKILKERNPNLFIVLGGYALEGVVGEQVIKSFKYIDCVSFGEGEKVISQLAEASLNKDILDEISDIVYRKTNNGEIFFSKTKKNQIKLDESPAPNYDDFVFDIHQLNQKYDIQIKWNTIPIETSRGCWWGQKNHCTYCGIDDVTMKYRQRSVENTIKMLDTLKQKYSINNFRISDYILPHTYYNSLLPYLFKSKNEFLFTCEIKANIKEHQFKLLKSSGFIEVQPGIESFSTNVLRKMSKGVSAIQNIYCILLGLKYTVQVNYNLIYGFPDDDINDYKEMISIIPLLYHLYPPSSRVKVAITRFAPLQITPEKFNLPKYQNHHWGYNVLFSPNFLKKHQFELVNYCYYFETQYSLSNELEYAYNMLEYQVDYWKNTYQSRDVYLIYKTHSKGICFTDTRYDETPVIKEYGSHYRDIYSICAANIITVSDILKQSQIDSAETLNILSTLVFDRLVFQEGDKYLGLALTEDCYENIKIESNKWSKPYV